MNGSLGNSGNGALAAPIGGASASAPEVGIVESVVAGSGISVDSSDPANPIVSMTDPAVTTIVEGDGIRVDDSDPTGPIVSCADDLRTTLVATGNTIEVAGLDGTNDGDYEGYFYLPINAATGAVKLQINGSDSDLYSSWVGQQGASTVALANRDTTAIELAGNTAAADLRIAGWFKLRSSAADAFLAGHYQVFFGGGATTRHGIIITTAAKTIASLKIVAANANAFSIGAYLQVRKMYRGYP
jgi:hypothetical protein